MATEFRFPDVGEGIVEGEIVEWQVQVGEAVAAHQTLALIETDKAVVEIPSPVAGTVLELHGAPGDVIAVGAVLAVIGETGEAGAPETEPAVAEDSGEIRPKGAIPIPGGHPRPPVTRVVERGSVGVVGELEEAPDDGEDPCWDGQSGRLSAPHAGSRARVLPRDRLLARKLGVAVDGLRGTGPDGRVTEADLRRAAELGMPGTSRTPLAPAAGRDEHGAVERVPWRGVRRRMAQAMMQSLAEAAQVTTTDEARVGLLWHIKEKEKPAAAAAGIHLTLLAFVVRAVVAALEGEPYLNATYDAGAEEVVLRRYCNMGVAVQTRDGLIVPNLKGAEQLSILKLAQGLQELSVRARERLLEVADLRGGTFTISNFGAIGGIFATPILNPPEVGLLGLGRVREQPVAVDGALKVERVLPLSLTFDHRVVDGATAQQFLNRVVGYLEDPDRLLVGH
ncbi:MAG: dihydrolipoamide acetyltransferase family protein [Deferrisomatales bacterium]|nr:dihydrolipoamide acetyltransferase family protein [Deferrisomatales bacterium]